MTRSIVVVRGADQDGPISPGTLVYIKAHSGSNRQKVEYGYHNLKKVDHTGLLFLGVAALHVPADQDEYTVTQAGEIVAELDVGQKLQKHDLVQPMIRHGTALFGKVEEVGPDYLVKPNTRASQGFGQIVGAIADAISDDLNLSAAQKQQARTTASSFVRNAMKAKTRMGARVTVMNGVREAQNGAELLLKAIREDNAKVYGRVMAIDHKKKRMKIATFKN